MPTLHNNIKKNNNNLKLLRLLGATLVIFSHSYPLTTGTNDTEPLKAITGITSGTLVVDIFFFISGFFVYQSLLHRKKILEFIKARVLRIYPGLLATLLCSILLCAFFTETTLHDYFLNSTTARYLFRNLNLIFFGSYFNLPEVFLDNPYPAVVNGSIWILPYQFRLYLSLLAFLFIPARHHWKICLAILPFLGGTYLFFPDYFSYFISFRLIFFFYAGVTCYLFRKRILLNSRHALLLLLATAILLYLQITGITGLLKYLYPFILSYLVLYFIYIPAKLISSFNAINDYSYGIYIYSFTIQQCIVALNLCDTALQLFMYALLPTIILAVLSYHFIEKPCLIFKQKKQ